MTTNLKVEMYDAVLCNIKHNVKKHGTQ